MQHIDPYSDDFFKKAGENYPLKTNSSEWENVSKKLGVFQTQNEIVNIENYKSFPRRSALVSALLLIPLAIAVTKYFNAGNNLSANVVTQNKPIGSPSTNSVKDLNNATNNKQIYNLAIDNIEKSIFDKNNVEQI